MKSLIKVFATLLVVLTAVVPAQAQFKFGIKAGLNVNKIHFNKSILNDMENNSTGWTAGVMAEFNVPVIGLALDASLMYTRMNNSTGDIISTDNAGNPSEMDNAKIYGKNFIEIPINVKYKFSIPVVASIFKPYVFTGPTFAFKLDKGYDDLSTRTTQVAWNVGLGLEFLSHLQIGASYGFGINDIAKHWIEVSDMKMRNNYWTVTAAYLF